MSDDDVIDLRDYLYDDADSPLQYFSVWGGDGEHSRFSLPLWRAIYIAVGERAGLVWAPRGVETVVELHSHFVLDLASEAPRTEFSATLVRGLEGAKAPSVVDREAEGLTVLLGDHGDRRWYLVVDLVSETRGLLDRQSREDLVFLAGEAAGLLFHRGLSVPAEPPTESPAESPAGSPTESPDSVIGADLPGVVRDLEHLSLTGSGPDDVEEGSPDYDGYRGDDDPPGPRLV